MSNINFLLTTEVLGQKIQPVEIEANFFLTPVRYLWNGRKVDLIQKASMKACQYARSFKPEEKSNQMWVLMVVLLVPGAVIGVVLKGYAAYKYHDKKEDEWIQNCLDRNVNGKIYTPRGDAIFGDVVSNYIKALRSLRYCGLDNKPIIFLSEINSIILHMCTKRDTNHFSYGETIKDEESIAVNKTLLSNISLLWVLARINIADCYEEGLLDAQEIDQLKALNPKIQTFSKTDKFSETPTAQEFFAKREQQPGRS